MASPSLDSLTPAALRTLFPSAELCVHLNHAGTAPIARPVAAAVQDVCNDLMSDDSFTAFKNHMKRQEELRAVAGRMMGVAPSTLAFVKNTSHGLTIAAQALPFEPGDVVVVPGGEYPSNTYPWMAQSMRGVETVIVPALPDGNWSEDALIAACESNKRARCLAVSWVNWGTGQRVNLAKLGAYCRDNGLFFVVDAVQGLGALQLDFDAIPIDMATAGCHKWQMAPAGIGVLYIREGLTPRLLPTNVGWNSVAKPLEWERMHWSELRQTPERYEEGTPNLPGTAGLLASLKLLETVGFKAVEERVVHLAGLLRAGLEAHGYNILSPSEPEKRSGIVAFRHPSRPNEEVLQILEAANIRVVVRCGNVRFSPHVYISEADIARALEAVPR